MSAENCKQWELLSGTFQQKPNWPFAGLCFSRHQMQLVILDFPDFNSVWPRAITGFMSKEKKPKEQQSRLNQCEVKIKPQKLLKSFYSVNAAK